MHTLAKRGMQQGKRVLPLYQQSLRNSVFDVIHRFAKPMFSLGCLEGSYSVRRCTNRLCDFRYLLKYSVLLVFYHSPVIDKSAYTKSLVFAPTAVEEQISSWA